MALAHILAILIGATSAAVIYAFGVLIYRLTFHPLAKYPGPFWARISQWPEAISSIKGRRHVDLLLLHEQYGDVVRISPDSLSFRSIEAVHDIYADRRANMIKTGWTEAGLRINPKVSTQSTPDRQVHAARRRLLSQAFSENALKAVEKYVIQCVDQWCAMPQPRDEKAGWSQPFDVSQWSNLLTLDVLGELCFGASFGAMRTGQSYIVDLLMSSATLQASICFMPIREWLYPIFTRPSLASLVGGKVAKQKYMYREELTHLVKERFAVEAHQAEKPAEEHRKDFFHHLLHATDPETGEKFTTPDLVAEAALLVGAGTDTSSTALSALLFYLTRHPRVLAKLQTELRTSFPSVDEIVSGPTLASQTYLRACIDEAMRMSPPVTTLLSRLILPGGATIAETHYPQGAVVGVPIYALHHDERYFPDNWSFVPERWLLDDPDAGFPVTPDRLALQRAAFIPFSVGPRACVARNMAYMEISIAAARLLWRYDVRVRDGDRTGEGGHGRCRDQPGREDPGVYQTVDRFISDREGPVVEFRPRRREGEDVDVDVAVAG